MRGLGERKATLYMLGCSKLSPVGHLASASFVPDYRRRLHHKPMVGVGPLEQLVKDLASLTVP